MFDWMFVKEPTPTEKELKRLYEEREWYEPTTEQYATLNTRIKELLELKEMENKPKIQVSGDTVVKCLCMVGLGAAILFKEELVGPVTSKALSLVAKIV